MHPRQELQKQELLEQQQREELAGHQRLVGLKMFGELLAVATSMGDSLCAT